MQHTTDSFRLYFTMQSYSQQTFIKNRFTNLLEIMAVPFKS